MPPKVAEQLGLGADEGVAAFVRFGNGSAQYLAATVTSSSIMKEQQHVIVARVATAAGALLLLFTGLGGWAFVTGRRAIALREMLRHAERIAHEHEKAEKILEGVPTLVLTLSGDGQVAAVNSAFEQRAGACALGGPLESVFPEAKRASLERVRSILAEANRSARPRAEYAPNMTLFGEEGQYSLHAVPLEPRCARPRRCSSSGRRGALAGGPAPAGREAGDRRRAGRLESRTRSEPRSGWPAAGPS